MKAIVLTCDKYAKIAEHMLLTYEKVWPTNPFTFRIPYGKYPYHLKEKYGDKLELIQAKIGKEGLIKPTVLMLLEDIPDEEWVYWCMDDHYLIEIVEEEVNQVYSWVKEIKDPDICSILLCRIEDLLMKHGLSTYLDTKRIILDDNQRAYIELKTHAFIFIPQFVRAKLLRSIFSGFPDRPFSGAEMDYFMSNRLKLPNEKPYVVETNLVVTGESTRLGRITANCVKSFEKWGLKVPSDFKLYHLSISRGKLPYKKLNYIDEFKIKLNGFILDAYEFIKYRN